MFRTLFATFALSAVNAVTLKNRQAGTEMMTSTHPEGHMPAGHMPTDMPEGGAHAPTEDCHMPPPMGPEAALE